MELDQPTAWENSTTAQILSAAHSMALSDDERRSYPRWYSDLLARNGSGVVLVSDTIQFISKFGIFKQEDVNNILNTLGLTLTTLDPMHFFGLLRLACHILLGHQLDYQFIFSPAPLLKPRSILSAKPPADKNPSDDINGQPRLDFDSFASFILTGEVRHKSSNNKKVRFSKEPPKVAAAAPLSMEDLMRQRAIQNQYGNKAVAVDIYEVDENDDDYDDDDDNVEDNKKSSLPPPPVSFLMGINSSLGLSAGQLETLAKEENKRKVATKKSNNQYEDDEKEVINALEQSHFKNVNIDSVLHHGTSNIGPPPVSFGFHTPPGLDSGTPSPSPPPQSVETNNTANYFNNNHTHSPSPLHNSTTVSPPAPMVSNAPPMGMSNHNADLFSKFESFTNSLTVPGTNSASRSPSPAIGYTAPKAPSPSPMVSFELKSDHTAPHSSSPAPMIQPSNTGGLVPYSSKNLPSICVSSLNTPPQAQNLKSESYNDLPSTVYNDLQPISYNDLQSVSVPSTPTLNTTPKLNDPGFYSQPQYPMMSGSPSLGSRRPPPPPAPPRRQGTTPLSTLNTSKAPPPPPPSRRKSVSQQQLPPQSAMGIDRGFNNSPFYTGEVNSALAASLNNTSVDPMPDLLADLRALQAEVDRISLN